MAFLRGMADAHSGTRLWAVDVGANCAFKHESFVDGDKTKPAALHHALGAQVSA